MQKFSFGGFLNSTVVPHPQVMALTLQPHGLCSTLGSTLELDLELRTTKEEMNRLFLHKYE